MNATTLAAWLGLAMCLSSACTAPEPAVCVSSKCDDLSNQIDEENAAHPEWNPEDRQDICGDANTGEGTVEHYATACKELRDCLAECH